VLDGERRLLAEIGLVLGAEEMKRNGGMWRERMRGGRHEVKASRISGIANAIPLAKKFVIGPSGSPIVTCAISWRLRKPKRMKEYAVNAKAKVMTGICPTLDATV